MRFIFIILFVAVLGTIPHRLMAQSQNNTLDSLRSLLAAVKNDSLKAALLLQVGDQYNLSKIDSAFTYYQKALDLNRELKQPSLQIKAGGLLAGLYNRTGDYAEALKITLENLKLEEEIHDTTWIFITKRELMWLYSNVGDHQKALEVARGMWSFANSGYFKDQKKIAIYHRVVYQNLGNIFDQLKQFDSALHYRRLAYAASKKSKNPEWLALATTGLEDTYNEMGNIDSSFFYTRLSIEYASTVGRTDIEQRARFNLAYLFQKKGQFDSAFKYAYRSLQEFKSIPDTANIIKATLILSELHKEKKQFDSAYHYLALYTSLKDKALTTEKIQKAQNLFFNDMLHQKQIEQERNDAQREYRSRLKIYSLLAGLAVMLLIAVILYRNNKHKQAAKRKVEEAYDNLKSTQAQLIQSEKMASLGELTAGIAHEIQNPLNFVNNFSEVSNELIDELQEERNKEQGTRNEALQTEILNDIKQNLEKINHHGKRADAIVKGMLQHTRSSSATKELTDINKLADEYLRLAYHGIRAKDNSFNATLKTDFDETIGNINIIPQDIGRVILNLITNAFYVVDEKKKSGIEGYEPIVSVNTKKLTNKVEISVKDNGNGIPSKVLDKIFQPFFTTKPTGQGTGLGLSLSYDIVKAHGGELKVETKEAEGSTFIIQIPIN